SDKSQAKTGSDVSVNPATLDASELALKVDKLRKQLHQLDVECRDKLDQEAKKHARIETEQMVKLNEVNMAKMERQIRQVQENFTAKIDSCRKEIEKQQREEVERLKLEEAKSSNATESKRAALEKEIAS